MATRLVTRLVLGLVAAIFALGALAFVHVIIWFALRIHVGLSQIWTATAIGGGDLLIAAVLGFVATRSSPSRVEIEALEVRRRAMTSMRNSLAFSAMLMPALRLFLQRRRR